MDTSSPWPLLHIFLEWQFSLLLSVAVLSPVLPTTIHCGFQRFLARLDVSDVPGLLLCKCCRYVAFLLASSLLGSHYVARFDSHAREAGSPALGLADSSLCDLRLAWAFWLACWSLGAGSGPTLLLGSAYSHHRYLAYLKRATRSSIAAGPRLGAQSPSGWLLAEHI